MKYRDIKKILLIRLRSLGDMVVITPCTRTVKQTYPECYLAVMVEKGLEDIFSHNPYVDEVIVWDKKKHSFLSQLRFTRNLRKKTFDMVINLHGGPRSCILVLLSGAKYRVGGLQKRHHFNWIYNIKVAPFNEVFGTNNHIHIVDRHLATLKCAGIEGNDSRLIFHLSNNDTDYIKGLMNKNGMGSGAIVSIHCRAPFRLKKMSKEKVALIADSIIKNFHLSPVFTGGISEKKFYDGVIAKMKYRALNIAGKTTVGQLGALYKQSIFFLGFDSGPAHIAAAVGTYVISLFGSSSVNTWHPWTDRLIIIRKDYECIGCRRNTCKYGDPPRCMESITPDEIIDSIRQNDGLIKLINHSIKGLLCL